MRILAALLIACLALPAGAQTAQVPPAPPALRLFTLGSAGIDGGYYAAARALCERVNRADAGRLRCSPEPTAGSLYNLTALRQGQIDFALVQSDWQAAALRGTSVFAKAGPDPLLRSVMALYSEPFMLLARRAARLESVRDLAGRRVDIGHPSSGRQATMRLVMQAFGLAASDFAETLELPTGSAVETLCAGMIDATVLIAGTPNPAVARALAACEAELVPVAGPELRALLDGDRTYRPMVIAAHAYPGMDRAVPTFAVVATLVTRATMDDAPVAALVHRTLESLDWLRRTVPVLAGLEPAAMRTEGLTAPMHPAAAAAFDAFAAARR